MKVQCTGCDRSIDSLLGECPYCPIDKVIDLAWIFVNSCHERTDEWKAFRQALLDLEPEGAER